MSGEQPTSMRLIGTLGLAGFLAGLVLVCVYLVTLPTIEANRAEALRKAIFNVLPGTTATAAYAVRNGALVDLGGSKPQPGERVIYQGRDDAGLATGYAIPGEGAGFQDTIKLLFGFDSVRRVIVGMEVLESRETPGLGDKIITDAHFLSNFDALVVEPKITTVKRGKKTQPFEVDTITGATISSKAVVAILNKSIGEWLPIVAPNEESH